MAEPEGNPRTRLWGRPAVGWRLAALALAMYPQTQRISMPFPPPDRAQGVLGTGLGRGDAFLSDRRPGEGGISEVAGDWIDYLSNSGVLALALAAALMLPGVLGRRTTLAALWGLVLCAGIAALAAAGSGNSHMTTSCLFYMLAAIPLVVGGTRAAQVRENDTAS
ncbi:hypothetical protein [Actinomadura sp. 9N407]|uniref:hypothetical protein n=1 Tax=Actinomadura sp. 9N407 TaxID=3375154 RepID=UPI0037B322AD